MKKHIGKLKNTDQRCVVVFMQIPGREDHALIVSTDNLPPRVEQALMEVVESQEGQADPVLARVLGRRLLPDTGQNLMESLHSAGLLRAVHIDQVVMLPLPNMAFPLRGIIEKMGNTLPPEQPEQTPVVEDKFNPHVNNVQARSAEERQSIARNLLIEANMLQSEADRKRETAYQYAPELAPKTEKIDATKIDAEKVVSKAVEIPLKKRTRVKKAQA